MKQAHLSELCSLKQNDKVRLVERARKMPRCFTGPAVDETVWHRSQMDAQATFRQHIHYLVIECIISQLDRGFSDHSLAVMIDGQALAPKSISISLS